MKFRINTDALNQLYKYVAALSPFCVGEDQALTELEVKRINLHLEIANRSLGVATQTVQNGRNRFAGIEPDDESEPDSQLHYQITETNPQEHETNIYHWSASEFKSRLPWLYNVVDFPTFITVDILTEDARFEVKIAERQ